jgi:hypothetical protein
VKDNVSRDDRAFYYDTADASIARRCEKEGRREGPKRKLVPGRLTSVGMQLHPLTAASPT